MMRIKRSMFRLYFWLLFLLSLTSSAYASNHNTAEIVAYIAVPSGLLLNALVLIFTLGARNQTLKYIEQRVDTTCSKVDGLIKSIVSLETQDKSQEHRINELERAQRSCLFINRNPSEFTGK